MKYIPILILLVLLLAIVGCYLYVIIRRFVSLFKVDVHRKRNKIFMIIGTVVIVISCANIYSLGTVIILYIILTSACMDIINFIMKRIHKDDNIWWKRIFCSSVIPIIATTIIVIAGYFNIGHVIRTDYTVNTDKTIRSEGYKIALLTDIHYGNVINADKLNETCKEIEATNPDMVILDGDIVDESTSYDEMKEIFGILGNLKSTYGSFYVYGNHDEANYSTNPAFTSKQLTQEIKDNGINILSDESFTINDEFTIVGRLDQSSSSSTGRKSATDLLDGVDMKDFILLLDHQPNEIDECSKLGYDLQLSGHTHGGQIWPIGLICEIFNIGDVVYGYEKIGDSQAIVSSGMSGWGYPIRTQSHSEYVIIDVKNR